MFGFNKFDLNYQLVTFKLKMFFQVEFALLVQVFDAMCLIVGGTSPHIPVYVRDL